MITILNKFNCCAPMTVQMVEFCIITRSVSGENIIEELTTCSVVFQWHFYTNTRYCKTNIKDAPERTGKMTLIFLFFSS